jgi:hypothetical protein
LEIPRHFIDGLQDYSSLSTLFGERPASPALTTISIPETEPDIVEQHEHEHAHDPIEDSQVQTQSPSRSSSQAPEEHEIPESLEVIVTTSQPAPQEVPEQPASHEDTGLATTEEEEPSVPVAATEDRAPALAQKSEQTTLITSTAEPSQAAAEQRPGPEPELVLEGQADNPRPSEVHAWSENESLQGAVEQSTSTNTADRLELEPPQAAPTKGTIAVRHHSPSASHFEEAQQSSVQPHDSVEHTTESHSTTGLPALANENPATAATPAETAKDPVQQILGREIVESSHSVSTSPVAQARPRPSLPDVEEPPSIPSAQHSSQSVTLNSALRASQALQDAIHSPVERHVTPGTRSSAPTPSQQHAQRVPADAYLSTQDEGAESIRKTIEKDEGVPVDHTSPQSRHDSSQESPEPNTSTLLPASSPLPRPPSHSLGTVASNLPPRPDTPAHSTQSGAISAAMDPPEDEFTEMERRIHAGIKADQDRRAREKPITPKRVLRKVNLPGINSGTRSPSTMPDKAPTPQVPTSLRTVATTNSMAEAPAAVPDAGPPDPAPLQEEGESGTSDSNNVATSLPAAAPSTDEELSDMDDASVLNDDLHLQPQEYVVPLPMDGRQASMYRDELKDNQEILKAFLLDPEKFEPLDKVQRVFKKLQAIETHIDLVFSASQPSQEIESSSQLQHQAQWSSDNSVKFRFIGALLHRLQDRDMRVLLVLDRDDARMFDIVENFMRGRFVNFKSPTRGHQADPERVVGNLMVTIVPRNSSPIVNPPQLIICLDGNVEAGQIRKKNWAANPDMAVIPLLHLVIPRTVDHIVRYTAPALDDRKRLHTVFATLAQLHAQGEIGRAMSHIPQTAEAADEIALFLASVPGRDASPVEWPLPSIGSIKDVVEYQSLQSQEILASPPRGKRPLVAEEDAQDPAKRMRFTPQPHPAEPTSSNMNNELTHISDSMPGTAVDGTTARLSLQQQLAQALAENKRLRDREADWSRQQVAHEERGRSFILINNEKKSAEQKLDAAHAQRDTLRERLETRTAELREAQAQHKALEEVTLLSSDDKTAEIARLSKALASAQDSLKTALASKKSSEDSFEYVKEQYRLTQEAAASLRLELSNLQTRIPKLEKQASGEVNKLAQIHYERQQKLTDDMAERDKAKIKMLEALNARQAEEIAKLKMGRGSGVGTRQMTGGSRPGSRAASPALGHRDRVANLRNG